ncbi:MAG: hypothetical protein QM586_00350 [Xenophilus sp.]
MRPSASAKPPPAAWDVLAARMLRRWWRRHPVHAAARLAQPALRHCARTRPAQLMLGSAALGGALVLLRPWRLPAGTAAALMCRGSDIADIVNTLLAPRAPFRQ